MRLFIASTVPFPELKNPHITYAFLGEQDASVVDRIHIDPGPAFEAVLQGCGFFPNRRRPRVGWIGVEPREKFIELAARVRSALEGIAFDAKEFKPHLTVMRMRDRVPQSSIDAFEKKYGNYRSAPFAVAGVTLYSSRLTASGAIHTALRTWGA